MREITKTETKTYKIYESDDKCFRSEVSDFVRTYEDMVRPGKPQFFAKTHGYDIIDGFDGWGIYKCETKEDYLKMIAIAIRGNNVAYSDIVKSRDFYDPDIKLYAVCVSVCDGDGCDDLFVTTLADLYSDLCEELRDIEEGLANLKADKKTIAGMLGIKG